jgi:16S rRNA (cytosine1402-N4)-methyltransferase
MHATVMLEETLARVCLRAGGRYVDGTLGAGGFALALLERAGPDARLLGLDRDAAALERARLRLGARAAQCRFVHTDFGRMAAVARAEGFAAVDGVVLDLGVSSEQLEEAARGFSFLRDGPLDMRMDPSAGEPAERLVNRLPAEDLAALFRRFGEEPRAGRIARAMAAERAREPVRTTARLAEIVAQAVGGRRGPLHPATRVFQALRIAVNGELESLEAGLQGALELLAPGGRLAVLSYHSLEDRIVKRTFAEHAGRLEALQQGGVRRVGAEPRVRHVERRPLRPAQSELDANPRARSARLRVVERES